MSLVTRNYVEFNSIEDVYNEFILLYDEAKQKGFDLGEALYTQAAFFTDYKLLLNLEFQNKIKDYRFCKSFSCPPYKSLEDTPEEVIDDFMIIDEEHHKCIKSIKQQNQKDK